jgi:hypothetical protein
METIGADEMEKEDIPLEIKIRNSIQVGKSYTRLSN